MTGTPWWQRRALQAATGPVDALTRLITTPRSVSPAQLTHRLTHAERTLSSVVADKVVLITGASSGIGAATARRLGATGATVVLVARSADKLDELASLIRTDGGTAHTHPCDLTDAAAVDALVADVLGEHGGVDILVNNAGRSIRRSLELSYDRMHDFERTMALNYFAALRLILAIVPEMRARGGGHVVNVSSAGVQGRVPRFGAYIASKAALDTACDAFHAETRSDGVGFTTIHMPLVRTPMIEPTALYAMIPALTPDDAAEVICGALIHRPRRLSPAFGRIAAAVDYLAPEVVDFVRDKATQFTRASDVAE